MSIFSKNLFTFSKGVFGLDLSDHSVKLLQLKSDGQRENVVGYSEVALPAGSVSEGDIVDQEKVRSSIQQAMQNSFPRKINTKYVICSLPETKVFLRIITLPKMKKEEAAEAIRWEIEANIPLSLDQVYFDWQILGSGFSTEKDKLSVLVVAVARNVVEQFLDTVEGSGLLVAGLEIESIAQTRSLLGNNNVDSTSLIIDIGNKRTSFVIAKGNIPCFTSSVPISPYAIISEIAKEFGVSQDEAHKIMHTHGIGSYINEDQIFSAVKDILNNLVLEIRKSMDFYLAELKYSSRIDKILVCGGGATIKGMIPYLARELEYAIELANPWINLKLGRKLPLIDRSKSVEFSTAIGLALRALHYEDID